jgi:hypothetical protein
MAVEVAVATPGKVRRPVGTALLSLIPFYWFVWYYRINRELRDFGRGNGDDRLGSNQPGLSLLAVSIGSFVLVPYFVSVWRTAGRVQRAERAAHGGVAGGRALVTGLLAVALGVQIAANASRRPALGELALAGVLVTVLVVTVLIQRRLNALWLTSTPLRD